MDLELFLRTHGIQPDRHEHPAVMTVEASERLVPKLPGAKTKNLFLRDKKGRRHFLLTWVTTSPSTSPRWARSSVQVL
jgi:Ala-tRNA(Pro) deacylase